MWTTNDGDEFPLALGQTFIEILPVGDPLKSTKAKDAGSWASESSED